MQNLIDSTEIGTLFLDRVLRVNLFTPPARAVLNLIPADAGRPLSDITTKLVDVDPTADAARVLDTLHSAEREVRTKAGRWFLMRLVPYRTGENRIDGVVITFVDITARRQAEDELRASRERLRHLMDGVKDYAIIVQNTEGVIEEWNAGAALAFGHAEGEAVGQHISVIFTREDVAAGVPEDEMRRAREDGRALDERWHLRGDGSRFYVSGVLTPLHEGGALTGYVKIARDQTPEQERQAQMEARVRGRTIELAEANVALAAEVGERTAAEERVKGLLRQLVTVQEDERRRVARDLHDHLGQQLIALRLNLEALKEGCRDDEALCAQLAQTQALLGRLDDEVDFLAWELRPAALDDLGLAAALANFVREWSKHFNIPADFHAAGVGGERLAPEVETNLYRIAQEALQNVYKHSQAGRVGVLLERRNGHVALIVEDDGVGFRPDDVQAPTEEDRGMGLVGMRERAAIAGGQLEIESTPGGGTTVFARVPLSFAGRAEGPGR